MELSPDQQVAFDAIKAWRDSPQQEFTLAGLAGTGKTTLVKEILGDDNDHHVMALSGKAASVLVSKGVHATTIHSHIYAPMDPHHGKTWKLKERLEVYGKLWVVDEASMVSTELHRDLLSFSRKILWVGDHGQLEPIGENPRLMERSGVKLEKIHRQAENSPIIAFAHALRSGRPFKERDTPELVLCSHPKGTLIEHMLEEQADQVIVGFNSTRHNLNNAFRREMKYTEWLHPGERIICLRNNSQEGVFNGLQGTVVKVVKEAENYVWADLLCDGREYYCKIAKAGLGKDIPADVRIRDKDTTIWDYAYAVTCHKSQGSEWPRVMVYEQLVETWDARRWSYTAATRASKRLTYISRRCL